MSSLAASSSQIVSSESSEVASSLSEQASSSVMASICQGDLTELSLHRPAKASTTDANAGAPNTVTDGDLTTRWSSEYSDNQWLEIDLGNALTVCAVQLAWETAFASAYRIDGSLDGKSWQNFYQTNNGVGGVENISFAGEYTARYLRLTGVERATEWGISLFELNVYGDYRGLPVAHIQPMAETARVGDTLVLDASQSFDDGALQYEWQILAQGQVIARFMQPVLQWMVSTEGELTVQLTVTDSDGQKAVSATSVTARNSSGNAVCEQAYFCEDFENGFGSGTQSGNTSKSRIDFSQGANGSGASFYYSTAQGQGDAWVSFTNRAMSQSPEIWISYYQKITKTPVPTNWFGLFGPADSNFPAFRIGTQRYGDQLGQNGVLGNWSCWGGNPCPEGSVSYDASLDGTGGRRPLPVNEWVCIEVKIEQGTRFSVYTTPSLRGDLADGAPYIQNASHSFSPTPIERIRLGYNPQSDSLEGWVDDVIIAAERPGCER